MKCPACHNNDTKVLDSRVISEGLAIRRRRECLKCSFRFSTYEEVEILNLTVVKNNNIREPYSREKLENGLRKALEKRPYCSDAFKQLVNKIEQEVQIRQKRDEIDSKLIGKIVMKLLKRFDKIAYIRFASVYNGFEDIEQFMDELSKICPKKTL